MKPYMIIEGSSQGLEEFEQKVASALELGYSLAGELVTQKNPHPTSQEIKFYQPVIFEDDDLEDDEDDDADEDENEYEDD